MSQLFTPFRLGPVELRNRTVRSAAFENMCPGNKPSQMLKDYHDLWLEYRSEQDDRKRILADRVVPLLEKAGLFNQSKR